MLDPFRDVSKEDKALFAKLKREARLTQRRCRLCDQLTAKNHVFPEAYLKNILRETKMVILAEDRIYRAKKFFHQYYFESVRIGKEIVKTGFGMQAYCAELDSEVFRPVDNMHRERLRRNHFILLAVRSLAHEYSKIESGIIFYDWVEKQLPQIYAGWGYEKRRPSNELDMNSIDLQISECLYESEILSFKYLTINKKIDFL